MIQKEFKTQPTIFKCGGVPIFSHNKVLDLGVGYISYAADLNETAVVLKGCGVGGALCIVVNGDKRKEAQEVIDEYSNPKYPKEGLFGEILSWACAHPDFNAGRSTLGGWSSRGIG